MTPHLVECPYCDDSEAGRGWIVVNPDWPSGELHYRETCPHCRGTGQIDPCELPPEYHPVDWMLRFLTETADG